MNTTIIRKSRPRDIPTTEAKRSLKLGNIENKIAKSHSTVHRITANIEFFSCKYLIKNHMIARIAIIGKIIEYNNI